MPSPRARPLVAGVAISHPDRIVYPAVKATKLQLAQYYATVAAWMLPHVVDRPLTLVRCPSGVGAAGKGRDCFYMKHWGVWAPAALRRVRIREKTKIGEYLIADSLPALVGLVQMGVVEIHTWNTRYRHVEHADRIVIDLDPGERVDWPRVVEAARLVRDLLRTLGLESWVKTTGGRGLHIVVPLAPRARWSDCLAFARALAEALARTAPGQFTTRYGKAGREDRLLVDYLRNNRTNTSIAAFSTRARPLAPVSTPLTWRELTASRPPDRWTLRTVPARFARRGDPWRDYWTTRQQLSRRAMAALQRL